MDTDPDPLILSEQADGVPALHTHKSSGTSGITQKHLWLVIIASIGIIVIGAGVIVIPSTFSSTSTPHHSTSSSSQPRASLACHLTNSNRLAFAEKVRNSTNIGINRRLMRSI
jgi:hypothetical protein